MTIDPLRVNLGESIRLGKGGFLSMRAALGRRNSQPHSAKNQLGIIPALKLIQHPGPSAHAS
jgi:hypothetical protein